MIHKFTKIFASRIHIQSRYGKSGPVRWQIWTILNRFKQVWTNLTNVRQVWKISDKIEKIRHTFYVMAHKFTNIFASWIQSRYSKSGQGRWQIGWQIQLGVLRRYFVDGECEVLRESPIETGLTGDLEGVCRFVGHCAILNGLGFSYKWQDFLLCRSN